MNGRGFCVHGHTNIDSVERHVPIRSQGSYRRIRPTQEQIPQCIGHLLGLRRAAQSQISNRSAKAEKHLLALSLTLSDLGREAVAHAVQKARGASDLLCRVGRPTVGSHVHRRVPAGRYQACNERDDDHVDVWVVTHLS